jgi:hypothetical protein
MYGTVRATGYGYSLWEFSVYTGLLGPTPTPLPTPTPTATTSSAPGTFWDNSNIPVATQVMTFKFLNRTNGKYPDSQVYWSFNGQVHTIADAPTFDMPANSSGRMYFGLGAPPNAANPSSYWDFIEFTIGPAQFNGNTTRVDATAPSRRSARTWPRLPKTARQRSIVSWRRCRPSSRPAARSSHRTASRSRAAAAASTPAA